LPVSLHENEAVLPLAHDGEFFLPVGHAMRTDSGVVLDIVRLPTEVQGRRSLTSAIRIVFHKLVLRPLGVRYQYPLLTCVDLGPDGKVQYDADNDSIRRRVAGASRIVLFVHGIIGDTTLMAGCIAARGLDELVMAFDYENLHTTIEENAQLLRDRLADIGLAKGHVKDFQIVAHSMGGLVSRWFIEQLGGKEVVKHLVMAGTPNAGSPWPTVQEWASTAAALAVNGLTTVAWPVQAIGWVLKGVERIDNALDEMTPGCPFLTQLAASADPHVPYTIIAGNTSIPAAVVVNGDESRLTRLLKKVSPRGVLHKGLTLALFQEPNDIAVTVTSIKQVTGGRHPAPVLHQTACDHVTYFTHAASLDLLRAALNWGPAAGAPVSSVAPL
jgi:pimeloyl-ACP methyl ester carboxylesterase